MNIKKILFLFCLILSPGDITLGADEHNHSHDDEIKLTPGAIKDSGIRIGKAELKPLVSSIVAPACISFDLESMAHVGSVVKGRVIEIKVRVGDTVEKNQELLRVESPELGQAQSDYIRKKQGVAVAELGVEPASQAYERSKKLFDESQGIALADVQKRQTEYRAAQANVMTARSEMNAAENTLHLLGMSQAEITRLVETGEINPQFAIRAPIAGKVVEREVTLGELVSPDKEKLLVLADTSHYWVLADVSEGRIGTVAVGSRAKIEVAAARDQSIDGTVSQISATVDAQTRSAQLRIVVANSEPSMLRPGMFARAVIWSHSADGISVLAVPEEAVQTIEGLTTVFVPVHDEPNTFKKVTVKTGKTVGGMTPIVEGLEVGAELVVSGTFILKAELGKAEAGHEH